MNTPNGAVSKCKPSKPIWLPLAVALVVPTAYFLIMWGAVTAKIDVNAQDIVDNGLAISSTPSTFVPRRELDAKLESITLQIGAVQANVDALSEQSERQTAEIIRKIERVSDERRVGIP